MLVIAAMLLLPAYLHSCSAARKAAASSENGKEQTEVKADTLPMHQRPIVVEKTWREAMDR